MDTDGAGEDVQVSMEITGEYDTVMRKLRAGDTDHPQLRPVIADMVTVLETIDRTGGGTRSVIAEALAEETTVDYDADAVVDILRILSQYELVILDGNTWKPGPALQEPH